MWFMSGILRGRSAPDSRDVGGRSRRRKNVNRDGAIGRARLTVKRLHRSGLYIDWIEVNDNHTPEQVAGMINQELVKHVKGLLSANQ